MSSEKFFPTDIAHYHGPEEKEKESVMLRLMQEAYAPVPPGPKRKEADSSVYT